MIEPDVSDDASLTGLAKRVRGTENAEIPLQRRLISAALLTHGGEDVALGGPSVRVPKTKRELEKLNVEVVATSDINMSIGHVDVIHGFNIWSPLDAFKMARKVQQLARPFIFSPILLDLTERTFWEKKILEVFRLGNPVEQVEADVSRAYLEFCSDARWETDFDPGYEASLRAIHEIATGIVFLSEFERSLYQRIVKFPPKRSWLIRNPVDAGQFAEVPKGLFKSTYQLDDYVLCVGRIEHRKNQLMLATALASTDLPLVLVGHEVDEEYSRLLRQYGGNRLHIVGRIAPGSEMLKSAIVDARVFALPSWAEGAPLAALEAGAAGVPLVLSNRSGEREYFEEEALYCDPSNVLSIREAVVQAWDIANDREARIKRRAMVSERFTWYQHACETKGVYETAIAVQPSNIPTKKIRELLRTGIVIDITGLLRLNDNFLDEAHFLKLVVDGFLKYEDFALYFIAYTGLGEFVEIPRRVVESSAITSFVQAQKQMGSSRAAVDICSKCSDLLTFFGDWVQDEVYCSELIEFSSANNVRFNVFLRDLDPHLRSYWYPQNYASQWNVCGRIVISGAHRIAVCSSDLAEAVRNFCFDENIESPVLHRVRLADEPEDLIADRRVVELSNLVMRLRSVPFVLVVGNVHPRENYALLFDVWLILRAQMMGDLPHLVIVGKVEEASLDVARSMREDARVNKFIHIHENVNTEEVDWLYKNCLFTVKPSLSSIWDVSIGRSLAYRKMCLATTGSLVPGTARDLLILLSPTDRSDWASEIKRFAESTEARQQIESAIGDGFKITLCAEMVSDLLCMFDCPAKETNAELYVPGEVVVCSTGPGSRFLSTGWHPAEAWGVWAGNKSARIKLRLAAAVPGDLILTMLARSFKRHDVACKYHILINGEHCGEIGFLGATRPSKIDHALCRILVPRRLFSEASEIEVTVATELLYQVRAVLAESMDDRELGFGLTAFTLESAHLQSDAVQLFGDRSDVKQILAAGVEHDLCTLLAESPTHPLVVSDQWDAQIDNFVRYGVGLNDAAASVEGALALALGVARLRISEDLRLQFWLDPDEVCSQNLSITILANGEIIRDAVDVSALKMIEVGLPADVWTRSDPLKIMFIGETDIDGVPPRFFLRGLRITEERLEAALVLPINNAVSLVFGMVDICPTGLHDRIPFFAQILLVDEDKNSVIVVRGAAGLRAVYWSENTMVTVDADANGNMLLPVEITGFAENRRGQLLNLALERRAILASHAVSTADNRSIDADCELQHARLGPIGGYGSSNQSYLYAVGWHSVERDGRCWGSSDQVSFWIRPAGAQGVIIAGDIMQPVDHVSNLSVFVDQVQAVVEVEFDAHLNRVIMKVLLPQSEAQTRLIAITGIPAARPIDLGLSEDRRLLSMSLVSVQEMN